MKKLTIVTINKRYPKDGTLGLTRCGLVCYFRRSIVTSTFNIGKHVEQGESNDGALNII